MESDYLLCHTTDHSAGAMQRSFMFHLFYCSGYEYTVVKFDDNVRLAFTILFYSVYFVIYAPITDVDKRPLVKALIEDQQENISIHSHLSSNNIDK